MKGLELPTNTLIIIIMALIVLIVVVALYMSGWFSTTPGISLSAATNGACQKLATGNCATDSLSVITITNYDADGDGQFDPGMAFNSYPDDALVDKDNLFTLCKYKYRCKGGSVQDYEQADSGNNPTFNRCCRRNVCGCTQISE